MASDGPPRRCVAVMAKMPELGQVKTRLAADLGAERATELYAAFLQDTWSNLPQEATLERAFFYAPDKGRNFFRALAPGALLLTQPDTPFGDRIRFCFEQLFDRGVQAAVLVGGDTPHHQAQKVEDAFRALEEKDVVLGPCHDGGYYLIGLNQPQPGLFEGIHWSTKRVLAETQKRASELGLGVAELDVSFDVDDVDDLAKLSQLLARFPELCPRTWNCINDPR